MTLRRGLLRLLRYRRALRRRREAERRVAALEARLAAEVSRNREREDFLASQVVTAAGRFAPPARAPDPQPPTAAPAPTAAGDELIPANAFEEAERDFFVDSVVKAGGSSAEGVKLWEEKRRGGLMPFELEPI